MYTNNASNRCSDGGRTPEQINELISDNQRLVLWYLARIGGRRGVSEEELVAAGMLGLWRAAQRYDPERGAFSTYAYRCIRQRIVRERDKAIRQMEGLATEQAWDDRRAPACPHAGPADQAAAADSAALVRRLMGDLPSRESLVIQRLYFDGVTMECVSEEIGCTRARVGQIRDRALARMRASAATVGIPA